LNTLLKRAVLLLIALACALTVCELIVRRTDLAPALRPILLHSENTAYRRSTNPLLCYELKPNYRDENADAVTSVPRTNAHGQRDIERTKNKPASSRRIILLGDSVVAGVGLRDTDDLISRRLENLYTDARTEILNFGVDGYNTLAEVELLRTKGLAFEPDHVLLLFVDNDFNDFTQEAWRVDSHHRYPAAVRALFHGSHLFRVATVRFNLFQLGTMAAPERWNQAATGSGNVSRGLAELRALAQKHGFGVTIAVWPYFDSGSITDDHFLSHSGELIIERLAAAQGLPCVRLSPAFIAHRQKNSIVNPRTWYTTGDAMHPSPAGARVAASILHQVLANPSPAIPAVADDGVAQQAAIAASMQKPNSADLMRIIAERRYKAGDTTAGQTLLAKALEMAPDDPKTLSNLGLLLKSIGRVDEAEQYYKRALLADPESPHAQNNLGMLLLERGDLTGASRRLERAVKLDPGSPECRLNLGMAAEGQGRNSEAESHYMQAIRLDPNYAKAYNNLGVLYANREIVDRAIPLFQRAMQLNPDFTDPFYNLGCVHELMGQTDRALPLLAHAAQLNPHDLDTRAALARVRATLTLGEGHATGTNSTPVTQPASGEQVTEPVNP